MCIFDFQYWIINLERVYSDFQTFLFKVNFGRDCGRIIWYILQDLENESCLVSKNKCWDLKDLIKHIIFHINIMEIWWILKEIRIRQNFVQFFHLWVNLTLFYIYVHLHKVLWRWYFPLENHFVWHCDFHDPSETKYQTIYIFEIWKQTLSKLRPRLWVQLSSKHVHKFRHLLKFTACLI